MLPGLLLSRWSLCDFCNPDDSVGQEEEVWGLSAPYPWLGGGTPTGPVHGGLLPKARENPRPHGREPACGRCRDGQRSRLRPLVTSTQTRVWSRLCPPRSQTPDVFCSRPGRGELPHFKVTTPSDCPQGGEGAPAAWALGGPDRPGQQPLFSTHSGQLAAPSPYPFCKYVKRNQCKRRSRSGSPGCDSTV